MSGDPAERRYSDEELRRILEDAAQSDVRRDAGAHAPDGHTLAVIRAIAGEVGIDPAAVDCAAANLGFSRTVSASSTPWHGFTRLLQEEHVIPRPLTNAEMRLVALHAERVMRRRGALRDTGRLVEWRDASEATSHADICMSCSTSSRAPFAVRDRRAGTPFCESNPCGSRLE